MATATGSDSLRPSGRFDRWLLDRLRRRRGDTALPLQLEYRDLYVLPTRFGFWFGVLVFLMLIGGLNFNNNMTLAMVFLLASIALLTTLLAYRNLVGITLSGILANPVFAGEKAVFRVLLRNGEERSRFAIQGLAAGSRDCTDIDEQDSAVLRLAQKTSRRGWVTMEPFHIENRYPLGLFRAWTYVHSEVNNLVYPAPAEAADGMRPAQKARGWRAPLLVLAGVPGNSANGSNRVGILTSNAAAATAFRRLGVRGLSSSLPVLMPIVVGSLVGVVGITRLTDDTFERVFGILMLPIIFLSIRKPKPKLDALP